MHDLLRSGWDEPRPAAPPPRSWRDWALVALLVPAALLEGLLRPELPWRAVSVIITVALVPTLLWRRSRPLPMVAVAFGVCAATPLVTGHELDLYVLVYLLLLPYALLRWGSGREVLLGSAIVVAKVVLATVLGYQSLSDMFAGLVILFAAGALSAALRYRARARMRELDQAKLLERERLARDLHDTVAHHVSAMAIRAQAGLATAASDPNAAVEALKVIEAEASRALAEMRAMVRVLRHDQPPERTPSPRGGDLGSRAPGRRMGNLSQPASNPRDGDLEPPPRPRDDDLTPASNPRVGHIGKPARSQRNGDLKPTPSQHVADIGKPVRRFSDDDLQPTTSPRVGHISEPAPNQRNGDLKPTPSQHVADIGEPAGRFSDDDLQPATSPRVGDIGEPAGRFRDGDLELVSSPRVGDIGELVGRFSDGPAVDVEIHGDVDGLPAAVGTAIYRLAQESVTNARRHARHATRIEVRVAVEDTSVRLCVSDDGETDAGRAASAPGYGLVGMIERAGLLGGSCEAGPGPGRGWTVTAVLPRTGSAK